MACGLGARASNALAGCLIAGVLSLVVWPAVAQAAPRCVAHGHSVGGVRTSRIIKLTGRMIVYRTKPPSKEGMESQDVWVCGLKSERFVLIGREELNEEYGTEGVLSGIHVVGNWLIVKQETGLVSVAECGKYEPGSASCPTASQSLLVLNAASGLRGSISDVNLSAGGKIAPLSAALLSPDGAVAWLQTPEKEASSSLYGCVAAATKRTLVCKPRLLAQGAIPAASLHLAGTTLSWTAAGQPKSSVL
jgi:hypothetical protein